ncbi:MAG: cell division protein FtsQ/DivIB [Flammeovirgaceae bacterium]
MKWVNFKSGLNVFLAILVLLAVVGFVSNEYLAGQTVDNIIINLDESGNLFVNEEGIRNEIMEVVEANLTTEEGEPKKLRRVINLNNLEKELLRYSFVKEAQASWDIRGNLVIDILQDEPVARVLGTSGAGAYISREKNLLPLSDEFSARVMLITGAGADSLLSETFLHSRKGKQVSALIDYINQDEFLATQITQLEISKWMGVTLYPQVGRHRIVFGKAEDFDEKFEKLAIFYEKIVPKVGWKKYRKISLQFKDQIVCK